MKNRRWHLPVVALAIAGGATLPVLAQTTGAVQGRVLDGQKKPVAGTAVRILGANLQGARTVVTDGAGNFRFVLLPPGRYALLATRAGSNPAKSEVWVGLDKTVNVDLALTSIAAGIVEVTEKLTTVDTTATTIGSNFSAETFSVLPTSRDYADMALLTPGVTQDNVGYRVYGASGAENNFVVDGINTTNAEYGTQGKKIPIEFIQEFQVKTGGFDAEYGKATGGVINVLTKSGGNEFTGDVFGYFEGNSLQSSNRHSNQGFVPAPQGYTTKDYGFDAGGFIIKDKLWYFVAYDRKEHSQDDRIQVGSTAGSLAHQQEVDNLYALKLTWQLSETQKVIASLIGDPTTVNGETGDANHLAIGPASSWAGVDKAGGTDFNLRYEVTGTSWFANLQASRHAETHSVLPGAGGNVVQVTDNTPTGNGSVSGGFGDTRTEDFKRTNFTGSLSKFVEDFAGHHEFKVGFDIQTDTCNYVHSYTGGQMVQTYLDPGTGSNYYVHSYLTTQDANIAPPAMVGGAGGVFFAPTTSVTSSPKHEGFTWFIQDKWAPTANWSINVGLRDDYLKVIDSVGVTQMNLANQLAPRLGITYDWKGKGQDKVYLSAGRFYEGMPMDLVIRSFSYERQASVYNFSPTAMAPDANWAAGTGGVAGASPLSGIVGGNYEPVDPNIKGQYTQQLILGVETTVQNTYVLGAKFIRNYVGRAIEDALGLVDNPGGNYMIMNPGISSPVGQGYPKATRDFRGLEFTAERKFLDHYTWRLSYLWSKLDGNYEGEFQGTGGANGTGQLDPNISSAFDEPAFLVNNRGLLSGDRRSQFKANGSYDWDCGVTLGLTATYMTGTPVTAMGMADQVQPFAYPGRYELFLASRGAYGTTPSTFQVNANLSYLVKLQGTQKLRLMLDLTNLLNAQTATTLDQRYNFSGLDAGQTNPNFLHAAGWMMPMTARVGMRYTF